MLITSRHTTGSGASNLLLSLLLSPCFSLFLRSVSSLSLLCLSSCLLSFSSHLGLLCRTVRLASESFGEVCRFHQRRLIRRSSYPECLFIMIPCCVWRMAYGVCRMECHVCVCVCACVCVCVLECPCQRRAYSYTIQHNTIPLTTHAYDKTYHPNTTHHHHTVFFGSK